MTKTFLISGAGTGIGRAICLQLQAQNPSASFVLLGRNEKNLRETHALLNPKNEHAIAVADIRKPGEVNAALARTNLAGRGLYGVVANAGVGGGNTYGTDDRWDEVLDTNLKGAYILFNEAACALRASPHEYRHVLFISSILARIGVPGYSAYCASKAGLLGLTRALAVQHSSEKILVNAICPGWVETDMAKNGISAIAAATGKSFDESYAREMRQVPLGKMSQPEEIGALAAYLMSDGQRSITGQSLDINNGAVMV